MFSLGGAHRYFLYLEATDWMLNNALNCVTYMINFINSNERFLDKEGRFYELPWNVQSSAYIKKNMSSEESDNIKNVSLSLITVQPSPVASDYTIDETFKGIKFFHCILLVRIGLVDYFNADTCQENACF